MPVVAVVVAAVVPPMVAVMAPAVPPVTVPPVSPLPPAAPEGRIVMVPPVALMEPGATFPMPAVLPLDIRVPPSPVVMTFPPVRCRWNRDQDGQDHQADPHDGVHLYPLDPAGRAGSLKRGSSIPELTGF